MNISIDLLYKGAALIAQKEIKSALGKLSKEMDLMNSVASAQSYNDDRSSINLPFDTAMISPVKSLVKEKSLLNPEYLIVIGIGGSNLGAMAVQEAVLGKMYNQLDPGTKVLYADTVDPDYINYIMKIVEPALKDGKSIILNVISKSGTTTETIANFEVLLKMLKKHKKDYQKYVVATTDKGSALWALSKEEGFSLLEIPEKVGGRYSVFSSAGLFPLGMLGLKIDDLLNGAADMRNECLKKGILNPAALSAALIYLSLKRRKIINDNFFFSNDFESVGKWYRQLMSESIGKEFNLRGKKVNAGITPTVSIGSTDLHSMAQLYLGGPNDKFTAFYSVEKDDSMIMANGKSLHHLMQAILKGTQAAYRKSKRPYMHFVIKDKSEYSLGQLLQLKMMEVIYLGSLLEVNPFDQPAVEKYKSETKKLLKRAK